MVFLNHNVICGRRQYPVSLLHTQLKGAAKTKTSRISTLILPIFTKIVMSLFMLQPKGNNKFQHPHFGVAQTYRHFVKSSFLTQRTSKLTLP